MNLTKTQILVLASVILVMLCLILGIVAGGVSWFFMANTSPDRVVVGSIATAIPTFTPVSSAPVDSSQQIDTEKITEFIENRGFPVKMVQADPKRITVNLSQGIMEAALNGEAMEIDKAIVTAAYRYGKSASLVEAKWDDGFIIQHSMNDVINYMEGKIVYEQLDSSSNIIRP